VDVRSADAIERWVNATAEKFGGIDLLMTNSGGPPAGPAVSFDDQAWQDAAELLLFSAIRMVRAAVPHLQARGGGAILVSTSSSVKEPIANLGLSTVLRASVSALAKTLAIELAPSKIRVNQIIPGRIDTDRVRQLDEINAKKQGITPEQAKQKARRPSRSGATARPTSSAAPARSCCRRRPPTSPARRCRSTAARSGASCNATLMRKFLLALSTNTWMREKAMRTRFVRRSVSRFMPGEEIDDALRAAATLKAEGFTTILTKLGENLTRAEEADQVTQHYLDVFDRVAAAGLDAQVSIKPTQLGLDLDRELCQRNLERLLERAEQRDNFLWIDMESSPYVDPTIELYRRARGRSARVGLAVQSYLYRTAKDIEDLIPLGPAIRMVKGAYLEPPDVAYPKKADVDENFYRLCARLMGADARQSGTLLHIGTHDPVLIDRLLRATSRSTACRARRTSSRCSTASSAGSSSAWPPPASPRASSSATASTGSPGTCAGSPNVPPMSGSSSGAWFGKRGAAGCGGVLSALLESTLPLGARLQVLPDLVVEPLFRAARPAAHPERDDAVAVDDDEGWERVDFVGLVHRLAGVEVLGPRHLVTLDVTAHLRLVRRTPGGPEVQQHRLAPQ
jgi:proline dehydrogenase